MNKSMESRVGGFNSANNLRQNGFATEGNHADVTAIPNPNNNSFLKVRSVRITDFQDGLLSADFTLHIPVGKKGREAARQAAMALPISGDVFITPKQPMAECGA